MALQHPGSDIYININKKLEKQKLEKQVIDLTIKIHISEYKKYELEHIVVHSVGITHVG